MSISPSQRYLEILKKIILVHTKDFHVKVLLFGSHAKNNAHHYSDIDIAILPEVALPSSFISMLKEKIEESNIPYQVDVVDLSQSDEKFRNKVLQEGIVWKD